MFDDDQNIHYAASGFGIKSDWYKNIVKNPEVVIRTAGKTFPVRARVLGVGESQEIFNAYYERHPNAIKNLARLIGYDIGESKRDTLDFLKFIPVIAFYPKE